MHGMLGAWAKIAGSLPSQELRRKWRSGWWLMATAAALPGQARYPWRQPAAVERDQSRRLQGMVAFAYRHVPYYRETMDRLGLKPTDFGSAQDLDRLPILDGKAVRRDPEYYVSTAQPINSYLQLHTGGSTGTPCLILYDTRTLALGRRLAEREAFVSRRHIGRSFLFREALLVPPLSTSQAVWERHEKQGRGSHPLANKRLFLSVLDPPSTNLRRLNSFAAEKWRSYGSYLGMLFEYIKTSGAELVHPKVIVFTSDALSSTVRRTIVETYGIPVYGSYSSVEAFRLGFECDEHTGYHINTDLFPVRIVDETGKTLPVGEQGEVVISNLLNRGTVLLNYRLGDLGALLPRPCPCGRTLPLLDLKVGRSSQVIRLPSGEVVHPQAIHTQFLDEDAVWQYQVVQTSPSRYRATIVPMPDADLVQLARRISDKFDRQFAGTARLQVRYGSSLARTPGGKINSLILLDEAARI